VKGTTNNQQQQKEGNLLLLNDTNLLQEVVANLSTHWVTAEVELDLKVLSEATRVVIAEGLGISKGLQQGVRLENLLLDLHHTGGLGAYCRDVLHDLLGVLCLASPTLTADNNTVVVPTRQKKMPGEGMNTP